MRHVKWPVAFPSLAERHLWSRNGTTSPEFLRSTRLMVTCSRSRPTTSCAKSAVPGFSRTQPERKSNNSMKDHVGTGRGNHIHGGLAAPRTPCGGKAIKSIASIAMDMPCRKEKNGRQAGPFRGPAVERSRSRQRCLSCFGQNGHHRRSRLKKVRGKKVYMQTTQSIGRNVTMTMNVGLG